MAIKAVLFDFGGVLVFHVNRAVADAVSKRYKLKKAEVNRFLESISDAVDIGKVSEAQYWKKQQ